MASAHSILVVIYLQLMDQMNSSPLASEGTVEALRGGRGDSAEHSGNHGRGSRQQQSRGRTHNTAAISERPGFIKDDIEKLALATEADEETVIICITRSEYEFIKAFKQNSFLKTKKVLKQLVAILFKLAKSVDSQAALRILAQLFGSSGEHATFLFYLQQLISEMPSERRAFIKEENLQALYHLTEIGKFCFEKIPGTVQNTFPVQYIQSTTESLIKYSTGSDTARVTLEDIEENMVELQVQRLSFAEEQARPKPKPVRVFGDVEKEPPEDFATLPILPTPDEINLYAKKPYLRPNIIKGTYRNWGHYLDIQFRLLREDFVGPLREGIADHLQNPTLKGGEVRVYRNVRIQQPVCLAMGIGFEVSFDMRSLRRVNWEYTKRLINGSLLCLSTDDFKTIAFASVAQREKEKLEKGIVTVKFEGSVSGFALNPQAQCTMVESVAYLEAYRHVLKKLQSVSEEHEIDLMPFKRYIVECTYTDIPIPRYLNHFGHTVFDLQGVIEIKGKFVSSRVDLTNSTSFPDSSITDLDSSQMRALKAALTQEISVIQGPPGTGKTYVGMKIVKAFLANREVWDPLKTTPILVVCYTNHALDQFLEGIRCDKIQRKAPNVTRIGGRCKSKILTECTLHEKVSKARAEKNVPRAEYKEYAEARREMVAHKDQIVKYLESIHISNKKILRIDRLRSIILEDHYFQLVSIVYTDNPMELWLGLLYEDPNDQSTQTATTPEQPVLIPQEIHDYSEALQLLEDSMEEDENTEVRMLQDDRLVEGTEVVYKASDNDQELPDEDPPKQKDNGGWQTVQMDEKKKKKLIYKQLSGGLKPMTDNEVDDVIDVWSLGKTERWKLYLYWREKYISFLRQQLERISGGYKFACDDFQQAKQRMDLTVIQGSDVVGMTTTGAAKHSYIIKSIRPKIVIIEEAAEIFEPHIFISLSPTVQQLILIGDHQQLPPKPTYFELEKNYNFNVSLFERLATNKCPVQTLNIQHRMRPEVASLITPAIYKELYNHESVKNYGHVQGVGKDLFFISHTEHEVAGADDRKSHSNPHEAKYIGALCDYLLKQGYKPAEITILTLYRGQLLEIKKTLRLRKISGVRSAVVDDFQGEENQIILLSLVRSNNDQKIGFVGIENRICVSLSRAKKGLYIIGNVQMLRTNVKTVWPKVIEQLTSMGSIGDSLPLHCHLHPDHKVNARTAEDFLKCPEGGCQQKCDARLPCGHVCRRMCHPYDIDHLEYKCLQKCSKRLPCGHQCKRKCHECSEGCKPCKERVTKILPTCGHSQKCNCCDSPLLLKCSRICERSLVCGHCCQQKCSEPCTTKCSVLVDKHLTCGHTVQDFCYLKEEHVECTELCDALLDCEHPCPGTCHSCKMGRLHTRCTAECGRTLTCGHICEFPCTPSCPPCSKRCRNYCNHSRCPKMCYEPCAPCMEPCDWSCDHFQCTQPCGMPCDRPPCNRPCKKFLKCGHRCIGLCGELCPKQCRVCDKDVVTEILFGNEDEKDARFILLPDCKHIIEVEGLDQWMSTESSNDDDESEEVTLKVCPKCKKPVRRCLRYGNNIRSKLEDVEAVKRKQLSTIQSINLPAELYKMRTSLRKTSSQSSRLVSEDLDIIERAIAKEQASANKTTFLFPHVLKAKLSFLLQIAMTYEIFNTAERSLVFSYDDRISKIKRNLNQLKVFIMQDFLSQQQLSDAEAEMRRLTLLAKLTELQVKLVPKRHQVSPSDNDLIQQCVKELEESGWKRKKVSAETEQQILCQIKSFRANYSIDKLSETERLEIVKAIGLSPGHWYKCPNGHYYAIGECGGAMQRGRCPECKADIGGMSHAIAAGNVHAPEMDGSRHAAWSDAANMENFDLQDLI